MERRFDGSLDKFGRLPGGLACLRARGAYQRPWLGTALAAVFIGLHMAMVQAWRRELGLILMAGAIGMVWDSFLVSMAWLHYPLK